MLMITCRKLLTIRALIFTSRLGVNSAIKSNVQSYESDFTILSLSYITAVKGVDLIVESYQF